MIRLVEKIVDTIEAVLDEGDLDDCSRGHLAMLARVLNGLNADLSTTPALA